jgi:hypothetical protein
VLRRAGLSDATVCVETGERCEVEVLGCSSPTFRVGGHHYPPVHVTGLGPGTAREYEVRLDGTAVWPEPGSPFPPSVVRTRGEGGTVKLVFGSCRGAAPHDPPYTLDLAEGARGLGGDAMYAMATRLKDGPPGELPDALVLLMDQIYAHKPPFDTLDFIRSRRDTNRAPGEAVADFRNAKPLSRVYQAVCCPQGNSLPGKKSRLQSVAWNGAALAARLLSRLAGVERKT